MRSVDTDVALLLASDPDAAFPCLVERYADLVYSIGRRALRDGRDAEELTQDVFLRAHRALLEYPPERRAELRVRPWLARIALNLARNALRRRAPRDADLEGVAEPATDSSSGPAAAAERRESAVVWATHLAALPDPYRTAVALRHVEGLSYAELAETLERPIGTVKSHVHRGVAMLRQRVEPELDGREP